MNMHELTLILYIQPRRKDSITQPQQNTPPPLLFFMGALNAVIYVEH
jgi:hypothetical protein